MSPCASYVVCFSEGFISVLTNGVGVLRFVQMSTGPTELKRGI